MPIAKRGGSGGRRIIRRGGLSGFPRGRPPLTRPQDLGGNVTRPGLSGALTGRDPVHPAPIPPGLGAGPDPTAPSASPSAPPVDDPLYEAPGGINPYTGQRLGPGEYVGVAGSEAQNPGLKRIPPPGWWDSSKPYYERRRYYSGGEGNYATGIEAGYRGSADDPYDTGRRGEINAELEGRGLPIVDLGEPGIQFWGPGAGGKARPSDLAAPRPNVAGGSVGPGGVQTAKVAGNRDIWSALLGDPTQAAVAGTGFPNPQDELSALLAGLGRRVRRSSGLPRE